MEVMLTLGHEYCLIHLHPPQSLWYLTMHWVSSQCMSVGGAIGCAYEAC